MKRINVLVFVAIFNLTVAQNIKQEKKAIKNVVAQFSQSIIKKDSATFHSLFHTDTVNWIGIIRPRSQNKLQEIDPKNTKNYFHDTYRSFFKYIMTKEEKKELFENVQIINDDVVASVIFDYTFWSDKKMKNYGKELWQLIKTDGQWKITSVIFSYELAEFCNK